MPIVDPQDLLRERDELRETVEHYRQLEDVFEAKSDEVERLRAALERIEGLFFNERDARKAVEIAHEALGHHK